MCYDVRVASTVPVRVGVLPLLYLSGGVGLLVCFSPLFQSRKYWTTRLRVQLFKFSQHRIAFVGSGRDYVVERSTQGVSVGDSVSMDMEYIRGNFGPVPPFVLQDRIR